MVLLTHPAASMALVSSGVKRTCTALPFAWPFGNFGLPTFLVSFYFAKLNSFTIAARTKVRGETTGVMSGYPVDFKLRHHPMVNNIGYAARIWLRNAY